MNDLYYNKIDEYHLGKLSAAEQTAFEAAMANDPALAAAVGSRRLEWEAQELLAEQQLRAQIRQAFAEQVPPSPSGGRVMPWKWILLSLLLLLLAGGLFFLRKTTTTPAPEATPPVNVPTQSPAPVQENNDKQQQVAPPPIAGAQRPQSPRQMAMAAYRTPESLTQTRGADTGDTLRLAYTAFSQKKYRQVVQLLTVLPDSDPQEALSLRAHAHFAAGQYAAAAQDFKDLEVGGIYRREAQWFGVLAAMALSGADKSSWTNTLQRIRKDPKHPYQKAAEALWKKVE
jgi:hypothetical protein